MIHSELLELDNTTRLMWAQSLSWEDPLEKEMATDSSILAWEIPWIEEPNVLQSRELQRVRHDLGTKNNTQLLQD